MSRPPTQRHGDALAVFDNARRVQWQRPDLSTWRAAGIWPDLDDARDIQRRLAQRRPLLVILDGPHTIVSLLAEELDAAAPAVAARVVGLAREPAEVHIPALDWLPEGLRRRGLSFLAASQQQMACMPRPLRPTVVLDKPDASALQVRFVHRVLSNVALDDDVVALVDHAFGRERPVMAAG